MNDVFYEVQLVTKLHKTVTLTAFACLLLHCAPYEQGMSVDTMKVLL